MIRKSEVRNKKIAAGLSLRLLLAIVLVSLLSPGDSSGFWPFTSREKAYLAKVGDEIVTKAEFLEAIEQLHKSDRAGKALSEQTSFAMQDFGKFLNELIDNKLMVMEAKNLGLHKEAGFITKMDSYALNLYLDKLRRDEILNKVKVEDKEIEDYYQEQIKKKEEEKKKAQEAAAKGKSDKEKSEEEKVDASKEEAKETPNMSARDREAIRKSLFDMKSRAREKEYFDELRKKANVKIDGEVLNALSRDKTDLFNKVVADVNGESIFGIDVVRQMIASKAQGEDAKKNAVEKLILYKLLDLEAMSRGYEDDEAIKPKIKKYMEQQLIEQFRKKVILPSVKVDETDISEYYKANQERYKMPDTVNLRLIHLMDEDEARAVFDEIKKGGDFAYLAKEKSVDPSNEKGGDIGWVPTDQLSDDINKAVREAKEGDVLGPFALQAGYAIIEFHGIEKGGYVPLDKVRKEIDIIIGREKFNAALSGYIKSLRETIPIEIDQRELDRMQGK